MRINDKELIEISLGEADLEGRLNHRRPPSGNFTQKGFKERWFKLKSNMLFYFRITEIGKIDDKQPEGVLILENSNIQYEIGNGVPFAFSMTFRDEPDRKHVFSGRSEEYISQWVTAMKKATYSHWRSQLIILQTRIKAKTGLDPLLLFPHNKGAIRNMEPSQQSLKYVGARSSSFQCHLENSADTQRRESKKSFQSHIQETSFCQNHIKQKSSQQGGTSPNPLQEKNLIEL